ncbi:HNH endonuclease [Mechercharimyces sp. CAU 1602]|nr:HNH endonuclease [Mechercharimyces sp. CAU 1602]MCS1351667.1 HNH endonuclease [Mechercharimyces sp. CAU 1602]
MEENLTWHYDKETGKLILVPYDLNDSFRHTGGHKYWGQQRLGGTKND